MTRAVPPAAQRSTLRGTPVVVAPGKVFLVGEYVVLDGGTAVVAAVSCLASGQFMPGAEPSSPLIAEAVRAAALALGERAEAIPYGSVAVDTDAFSDGGRKLGLGSSAAAAAVTVGAIMEMAGVPVARERARLFEAADAAHRAAQGGVGSGADVAASVYGGLVRFRRPAPEAGAAIEALPIPAALDLTVFAAGAAADTPAMVRRVRSFAAREPGRWGDLAADLRRLADAFVDAVSGDDVAGAIAAARGYGEGLARLGDAADAPIVTPAFRAAAALAAGFGGAAKPSGAGGGDVGVALFATREAGAAFRARLPREGLAPLDVTIDFAGTRRRLPTGPELARAPRAM